MNNLFLLLAFATSSLIAQDICESSETSIEDLNNITKCNIENTKKIEIGTTREISIRVPSQNDRYLRKRNFLQEEEPTENYDDDLNNIIISKEMLNALNNNL